MGQAVAATKNIVVDPAAPGYWAEACKHLVKKDRVMKRLIPQFADAALQTRGDAFGTLARSIVGQQISVKAAQTVWDRFALLPASMEPEAEGKAWLTAHASQWDLAIVDLFLRQGSGLGVLAACRDRTSEQKMVVLSNYATPDVRMRCAQLGVDAVFDKSNEIDALVDYCIVHSAQRPAAAGAAADAQVNRSACS